MDIDWAAAKFLWNVFQAIVMVIVSIFVWLRTRNRVTEESIEHLKEDVRRLEKEVSKRTGFGHLDDVRKELELTNRRLSEVSARLEATSSLLDRMHEFLLQNKK